MLFCSGSSPARNVAGRRMGRNAYLRIVVFLQVGLLVWFVVNPADRPSALGVVGLVTSLVVAIYSVRVKSKSL